jgi:hypothetical protein
MLGLAEACQVRVDHRGNRAGVAEVDLELTEVLAFLQEMRRVGMTQRVDMGGFLDAAGLEREPEAPLQRGAAHGFCGRGRAEAAVTLGGKEQRGMVVGFPLLAQQLQSALGQRNVTVLVAFARADVQEHPRGINVADLQLEPFTQTQATGVDGGETNALIQQGDASQHAACLRGRKDDGQFELSIGADECDLGGPGLAESFLPEEFDGAERLGGSLAGDLLDRLEMDEVLAQLLGGDQSGGLAEELAELADAGEVGLFGAGPDWQERQVLGEGIKDGVRGTFFICMRVQS